MVNQMNAPASSVMGLCRFAIMKKATAKMNGPNIHSRKRSQSSTV